MALDLKALIAKQKGPTNEAAQSKSPEPANSADAGIARSVGLNGHDGNIAAPVHTADEVIESASAPIAKPRFAFGKPKQSGDVAAVGNDIDSNRDVVSVDGVDLQPVEVKKTGLASLLGVKSTPNKLTDAAPKPKIAVPSGEGGAFSLDDIANFETADEPDAHQIYADMIPADMPDRELPEDMTDGMQSFVELIGSVYETLNEPEAFGQVIRNLMAELQENPEYDKLLVDADVNSMMRGLRQTMGLAQIKKASTKKSPVGKKALSGKAAMLATSLEGMFGEDDFDA